MPFHIHELLAVVVGAKGEPVAECLSRCSCTATFRMRSLRGACGLYGQMQGFGFLMHQELLVSYQLGFALIHCANSIVAVRSFEMTARCFCVCRWGFSSTSESKIIAKVNLLELYVTVVLLNFSLVLTYMHMLQNNIAGFCFTRK